MTSKLAISVLVPTYLRSDSLIRALQSILSQEADVFFEVIVLDNGCDKGLKTCVLETPVSKKVALRYVPVPDVGLHNARHAGVREAKSDLLVFVDDDIIAGKGWLQAVVDTFRDPAVHMVGGPSLPLYEINPPEWLNAYWIRTPDGKSQCSYLSVIDYGSKACEINPTLIWGLNYSIRKTTLQRLGGFHPDSVPWDLRRFRGDGESAVSRKAKRDGIKAIYQPDAKLYHAIPKNRLTVEYFERRGFLQGISDSFSRLRQVHGIDPFEEKKEGIDWLLPLRIPGRVARRIMGRGFPPPPDPYEKIKARVEKALADGYAYHQHEVKGDPELLKWVLRDDYWSARIPGQR